MFSFLGGVGPFLFSAAGFCELFPDSRFLGVFKKIGASTL